VAGAGRRLTGRDRVVGEQRVQRHPGGAADHIGAVEPALIRRQTEPDGGEFAELLGKGRAAALLGPAGDDGAGGAECAGVVFDQVGVGLAEQDPAGGGAQVVAASWACTVEVPLPNSAVTTDSSYTPPGRSWMRASAWCPRGGTVAIIATAETSPVRHSSPSVSWWPAARGSAQRLRPPQMRGDHRAVHRSDPADRHQRQLWKQNPATALTSHVPRASRRSGRHHRKWARTRLSAGSDQNAFHGSAHA
jgi:hypothetical protein